jgi:hypothetical protein
MGDYDGMTNQDVDPVDVWEEMRDGEFRLDAADEERALAAERDAPAEPDDPDDCGGEFIDGTWHGCGACEACLSTSDDTDDGEDDG